MSTTVWSLGWALSSCDNAYWIPSEDPESCKTIAGQRDNTYLVESESQARHFIDHRLPQLRSFLSNPACEDQGVDIAEQLDVVPKNRTNPCRQRMSTPLERLPPVRSTHAPTKSAIRSTKMSKASLQSSFPSSAFRLINPKSVVPVNAFHPLRLFKISSAVEMCNSLVLAREGLPARCVK